MTVEQRLARLEHQNRWLKRIGAAGMALIGAVLLMGQQPHKRDGRGVVAARSFVLVDEKGRERLIAESLRERVDLRLLGTDRLARFAVNVGAQDTRVSLGDDRGGTIRASVSAVAGPAIEVLDRGVTRISAGLGKNRRPELRLFGKNGRRRAVLALRGDGTPALTLCGKHGKQRFAAELSDMGTARLVSRDKDGSVVWQFPDTIGVQIPVFAGKEVVARAKCEELYVQTTTWKMYKRRLPGSLKEMEAPLEPGHVNFITVEDDPWGNRYVLEREGEKFRIVSFGPDGVRRTADDIQFPPKE